MGVVNVTPDSFYEGSRYPDPSRAIDAALELVEAGADIIDIGGESTRPGGREIDSREELDRIMPVLERVRAEKPDVLVSIDTRKAFVAERALDKGADIINDISALGDPGMLEIVARSGAGTVLMHMRGTPETMQHSPAYDDVVAEVKEFLRRAVGRAEAGGISGHSILVDPGIGFGKRIAHNLELLANLDELVELEKPVLAGTSRKSFIGKLLSDPAKDRIFGTAASVAAAILNGASVVRVHDVREMGEVASVTDAIRAATRPRRGATR